MDHTARLIALLQESIKFLLLTHNIEIIDFSSRIKANDFVPRNSVKPNDYLGIRLILNSEVDCLTAGKLILDNYEVLNGRYRDYISRPWSDGYQSIHIDILFKNNVLEIQIRTPNMDKFSKNLISKKGNYYWHDPSFKK